VVMTVPRKNAERVLKSSPRYISLEHWQVNVHMATVSQMQSIWDMFPKPTYQGFGTWLTYRLSTRTKMLTPKHLLLLYNHAPLSRTLMFSSLSSRTLFLRKEGPNHMFSAVALDDIPKPEAQVCLWAWGGIGAHSMDGKKCRWQLPTLPLRRAARASAAPDLGRAGVLLVPSSGVQF